MIPVATPAEMAAYDRANLANMDRLIVAAGWWVARNAIEMMGGTYGRRVVVIIGPGNNGADGAVAERLLSGRGVAVSSVSPGAPIDHRRPDLVIDAAFGMGLARPYVSAPVDPCVPVLAVDIPSGLDGLTGQVNGSVLKAARTVTFVAAKPGLFLGEGPALAGEIVVADLGIPHVATNGELALVTASDVAIRWPRRRREAHKWHHAVWIIGGGVTMTGAPRLAALGAQRAGAGYVRLSVPGVDAPDAPIEAVLAPLAPAGWGEQVALDSERIDAVVIGPGLGRSDQNLADARMAIGGLVNASVPMVIDADALGAIADVSLGPQCVLTPHDGEYATLTGHDVPTDRVGAVRELAATTNATVLLKGPTTLVAAPDGRVHFIISGDARLATAGSGDVLSGMIGALLSYGLDGFDAASMAAWLHGQAAGTGPVIGLTASGIAARVPAVISELVTSDEQRATL